jgi:hypothetical protein
VDLQAEDQDGGLVVIENQLEASDHKHLGQLVTYLANLGATIAIWLVAEPCAEHVRAISWLNESTAASFYLVRAEAVRIGDSPPAPLFTLIVGPSEVSRDAGAAKEDLAERHVARRRFWDALLPIARTLTDLHAGVSPGQYMWLAAGAGRSGMNLQYIVREHECNTELYIDRGKDSDEENAALIEQLHAQRERIEEAFGGRLDWDRMEGRRACRVRGSSHDFGWRDDERWAMGMPLLAQEMARLEKALRPHIKRLRVDDSRPAELPEAT